MLVVLFLYLVLQQINNNIDTIPKQKEVSNESTSTIKKVKYLGTVSIAEYEKLKRENKRLKKESEMYKSNWWMHKFLLLLLKYQKCVLFR